MVEVAEKLVERSYGNSQLADVMASYMEHKQRLEMQQMALFTAGNVKPQGNQGIAYYGHIHNEYCPVNCRLAGHVHNQYCPSNCEFDDYVLVKLVCLQI